MKSYHGHKLPCKVQDSAFNCNTTTIIYDCKVFTTLAPTGYCVLSCHFCKPRASVIKEYCCNMGEGKTMYAFSANANVLSANFPFSVLPAGGEGMGTLVR